MRWVRLEMLALMSVIGLGAAAAPAVPPAVDEGTPQVVETAPTNGGTGAASDAPVPRRAIYEGGLSREEIQRGVSKWMGTIKSCYERALNQNPTLEGKIVAKWVIDGTGSVVDEVTADSTLTDPEVERCVRTVVRGMHFPRPKGGGRVFVSYPFVFSSDFTGPHSSKEQFAVTGGLSRADVSGIVDDATARLGRCYTAAHDAPLGRATVRWAISAEGYATDIRFERSTLDDNAHACIKEELAAIQFPVPRGGDPALVTLPLYLFPPELPAPLPTTTETERTAAPPWPFGCFGFAR